MRTFLIAIAIALALPGAALASGRQVLKDCGNDEHLSKTYTLKDYRDALSELSADANEYTNCSAIIRRAELAAAAAAGKSKTVTTTATTPASPAKGSGTNTTTTATTTTPAASGAPTPQEQAQIGAAQTTPDSAVVGGNTVSDKSDGGLPTPVIVLIGLLVLGALAFAAVRIKGIVDRRG